jgi:hypothetical protein
MAEVLFRLVVLFDLLYIELTVGRIVKQQDVIMNSLHSQEACPGAVNPSGPTEGPAGR